MPLRVRTPQSDSALELSLDSGRITAIQQVGPADDTLPLLLPGLVDVQVNGYGGREFSSPSLSVDDVATITAAQRAAGVARYCPTVTTASADDTLHGVRTIGEACERQTELQAAIAGIHVEGPYISPEEGPRGAHPLPHVRPPHWDEFQRWQEASGGRIKLITLSAEYPETPRFVRHAVNSGVVVALGHQAATHEQIRRAVDAGATLSTHLGNGAHGQLRRHPNYLWSQLADDRLSASLIVDGFHLPAEVVKTFVRAKSPERCLLVSDLSGLAGLPPGRYPSQLCEIDILPSGKLVIAGQDQLLAAASSPLSAGIANVMRFAGVSFEQAWAMASTTPSALLKLEPDRLDVGQPFLGVLVKTTPGVALESLTADDFEVLPLPA